MENEFKPIAGYENEYEINIHGEVYSKERYVKCVHDGVELRKRRLKKKTLASNGYYVVCLHKDGIGKMHNIHRLIAQTFIPNPNNYLHVNHKDGNKLNNTIDNLEWCTQQQNVEHAYKTGLTTRNKPVICVETGEIFRSSTNAATVKFGDKNKQTAIRMCANGTRKTAYGYTWRYV